MRCSAGCTCTYGAGSCRAAWKTQPDLTARRNQPESVMLQYYISSGTICPSIRLMLGSPSWSRCCWHEPRTNEKQALCIHGQLVLVPSSCLRFPAVGRLTRIFVFTLPISFGDGCRSLQGRSNGQTVQKWSLPRVCGHLTT